jgi:hypothetical protein
MKVLTLPEALALKLVVVHETGSVNELAVENLSVDHDVFIHSGDIVKGGRQDRMVGQDMLLPPRSGRVPLGSFCVEQGRWSRRGAESPAAFGSADKMVIGNALKMAARRDGDQGQVWREVSKVQAKLSAGVSEAVASEVSPSSLQLALENPKVRATTESYVEALIGSPRRPQDIVGCVFAINGRVTSAEVYASSALFQALWPRLLRSAAAEAIGEGVPRDGAQKVTAADARAFLAGTDQAAPTTRDLDPRVRLVTRESEGVILFETRDRAEADAPVHRSYLAK